MTDKVNPSIDRPTDPYQTATVISESVGEDGWVVDGVLISDVVAGLTSGSMNAFAHDAGASSGLDVVIDPGEAIVGGSWVARDAETTVTVDDDTAGQTIYVGWDRGVADTVIIGLASAFASEDYKIPLHEVDASAGSVDSVTDQRDLGPRIDVKNETYDTDLDGQIENAKVDALVNFAAGDSFNSYPLANSDLENSQVTVAGNAVALGGSTAIAHGDLSDDVSGATDENNSGETFIQDVTMDDHGHVTALGTATVHSRYTDEEVRDVIGAALAAGANISVTVDDPGDTITIATDALDAEEVDDRVNSLLTAGGDISLSYDDGANELTIAVDTSSLDADTVDGEHAAAFANAGHTHPGGDITSQVSDSDKLDGQHAAAFMESFTFEEGDGESTAVSDGERAVIAGGNAINTELISTNPPTIEIRVGSNVIGTSELSFDPATQSELDNHAGDAGAHHAPQMHVTFVTRDVTRSENTPNESTPEWAELRGADLTPYGTSDYEIVVKSGDGSTVETKVRTVANRDSLNWFFTTSTSFVKGTQTRTPPDRSGDTTRLEARNNNGNSYTIRKASITLR